MRESSHGRFRLVDLFSIDASVSKRRVVRIWVFEYNNESYVPALSVPPIYFDLLIKRTRMKPRLHNFLPIKIFIAPK